MYKGCLTFDKKQGYELPNDMAVSYLQLLFMHR
ncbi:hypothetical protein C7475_10548 [Chitinophaga sp. S165]|nr:hypothetical protein C7475_10548 [Chitinophaga sp. S165]